MNGEIFFIILLIFVMGHPIINYIMDERSEAKEMKRLENTPIEVHRYKYKIHLIDGSKYEKESDFYVTDDFEEFVRDYILKKNSIPVVKYGVINPKCITKVDMLDCETRVIKPAVNHSLWVMDYYEIEEIEKREVK